MALRKERNLWHSVTIMASPREVFEALVDPKEHAKFTGAFARLEKSVGGRFSHYNGSLSGVVVSLEPNRRLVLAWRSSDWPEGHHSLADFRLRKVKAGTRLDFAQFGIPASDFSDIRDGWRQCDWEPLKQYLER